MAYNFDDVDEQQAALAPLRLVAPPGSFYVQAGKRAIDLVVAAAALVALAPVMGAIALAVRISLGRGVLFRQTRVGKDGADFEMLKFRTMKPSRRVTQLEWNGPDRRVSHKTTEDPRHTRVGRFLRRMSLDELPQLINVLRGEMSLVGPRPEISSIVDRYRLREHPRHAVTPGMTGEWQITHRSTGAPLHQCFDSDLPYLTNVSLSNDVRVLARTVAVLGSGS